MSFDEKESLSDRLKKELDKKEPDRDTVIQILKEVKKEESGEEQTDPVLERYGKKPQKQNRSSVWKRLAVAAAICLIVLSSVPNVFGSESIFTMIGQWTKEIFSFGEIKEKEFIYHTDHPGLQELYDAVAELGLSKNVVPTWIPEEAALNELYTQSMPNGTAIFAGFFIDNDYIGIAIYASKDPSYAEYQKGNEDAVLYERAGIKHYILENDGEWAAAWVIDNAECTISVKNKEVLYKILEYIYLSEGER